MSGLLRVRAVHRLLYAILILSGLALIARAFFGPFRFLLSVASPMNAEGIFALTAAALLCWAALARVRKPLPPRERLRRWAPPALIAAAGIAAYAWTFRFPFLADDYDHLPGALHASLSSLAAHFTHPAADRFFRPAAFVFYALQARAAGFNRARWHALSLLLHICVALLLYAWARRRGFSRFPALGAALLFVLHGSRPEAVTWIAAQFDLWAALFFLLALLAFERRRQFATLACLLAALLSKESAYVFPLVVLLLLVVDRVPLRQWPRLAGPPAALTAAVFLYRWRLLGGIGGYLNIGTNQPYILTFDLLRTAKALTLRLAAALTFPIDWSHSPEWWLIGAMIAAMAAGAVLLASRVAPPRIWLGLGFILIAALPVHEFLLINADLEKSRVLYLPSVGFALLFAAMLEAARPRFALAALCAILLFQTAALEHNLKIWGAVAQLADRTCAGFAHLPALATVPDMPNTVDGVYFLHTGLRGCIEAAAGRPRPDLRLASETR